MTPFVLTNVTARRITIAHQDIDPGKTSRPLQVMAKDGKGNPTDKVDPEATAHLVERVKASAVYRAGWLKEGPVTMPEPAAPIRPDSLANVDDVKALAYVKIEGDMGVLATWAEQESRGEKRKVILDAIGARAAEIRK